MAKPTNIRFTLKRVWANLKQIPAYCPVYFPKPPGPFAPMQVVHETYSRNAFRPHPNFFRQLARWGLWLLWPWRALLLAYQCTRAGGGLVRVDTGKGLLRQFGEQLNLALTRFIPPQTYYWYRLYLPQHRRKAHLFLLEHECSGLNRYLNGYGDTTILNDKLLFADYFRRAGLPAVDWIAEICGPAITYRNNKKASLPMVDLFVKPSLGARGYDAELWLAEGSRYRNQANRFANGEALMAAWQAHGQRILVQERLVNHPQLEPLSNGQITVGRLITGRYPDGSVIYLSGVLKMPVGRQIVNNYGLNSAIDARSGQLGRAYSYNLNCCGYAAHPDSGACIVGTTMPHWDQAVNLVTKAHGLLPQFVFLGWDVVFTLTGPLLLEANQSWGAFTLQRPHGKPLGQTEFVEVCHAWFSRR